MTWQNILSEEQGGNCYLKLTVPKTVKNFKSCDMYVNENNVLFCCDNILFRHFSKNSIDIKDIKELKIKFDTSNWELSCILPFIPEDNSAKKSIHNNESAPDSTNPVNMFQMKQAIESCILEVDGVLSKFEERFSYGFGCEFYDETCLVEDSLRSICNISNPSKLSPLQRWYQREQDEHRDFCRDQYKLNFIELQVPEGLENPLKFVFNPSIDVELTKIEEYTLKTINEKTCHFANEYLSIIDCGLIDILLAICYDVRSTQNEVTCESAWTRSRLSATLCYFDPIISLRNAVEIFFKRSLIYPLYRNYDLSRLCVEDAIEALQKGSRWIVKQFLITYDLFLHSDENRSLLNRYFIEPYLRYLTTVAADIHLKTLSRNLKNILLNLNKRDLRLDLSRIEAELLRELIDDMHLADSDSDDTTESGEDTQTSSEDEN